MWLHDASPACRRRLAGHVARKVAQGSASGAGPSIRVSTILCDSLRDCTIAGLLSQFRALLILAAWPAIVRLQAVSTIDLKLLLLSYEARTTKIGATSRLFASSGVGALPISEVCVVGCRMAAMTRLASVIGPQLSVTAHDRARRSSTAART